MEIKTQEEKANKRVILVGIAFVVMIVFAWLAGGNIGEDLGTFIYNVLH